MQRSETVSMATGSLWKKIIAFSVPLMLTSILQLLYNTADTIVVGKFVNASALAAVGSTGSLINLLVGVFTGISVGANFWVARDFGARDYVSLRKTLHCAVATSVILGLLAGVAGFLFARPILQLMDTPEDVLPQADIYLQIYFIGVPAMMIYNFAAAILRAMGETKYPLTIMMISGAVNVVLNVVLVTAVKLGVAGVAIATSVSQCLSMLLVLRKLMRFEGPVQLKLREIRLYKDKFFRILGVGISAGIQSAVFSISNVMIQSKVNSFLSAAMAGNSAASSLEGFIYIAQNAFFQAAVTCTSQNLGAGRYDRLRKTFFVCMAYSVLVGGAMCGLLVLCQRPLLSLYISKNDPDLNAVLQVAALRISVISCWQWVCGLMEISNGFLRGLGQTWVPTVVTLLGACGLRLVWIYTVFAHYGTLKSLYISYPLSWLVTFLVATLCFIPILRRLEKRPIPKSALVLE